MKLRNELLIYTIAFIFGIMLIFINNMKVQASYYDDFAGGIGLTTQELKLYSDHPFKAITAKGCADDAIEATNDNYRAYTTYQGNGDAFRHAYWSALMTKKIDRSFAYDAGLAHEGLERGYEFDEQSDDVKMDISNNYSGRIIGDENSDESDEDLCDIIIEECSDGNLKRIRTYTYSINKNTVYYDGTPTKYVGYYVETTDGGLY